MAKVHAVAKEQTLALNDDVAEMDAHPETDAMVLRQLLIAARHLPLHCDRALSRFHDTGKLGQQTVAHQLEYAAVMVSDLRFEKLLAERPETRERSGLVLFPCETEYPTTSAARMAEILRFGFGSLSILFGVPARTRPRQKPYSGNTTYFPASVKGTVVEAIEHYRR